MNEKKQENKQLIFFMVLFNPDSNALDSIKRSVASGFKPVVYLNKVSQSWLEDLPKLGVTLLGNNENVGLGRAFSELEDYLIKEGFVYYIYFDQDTLVPSQVWEKIKSTHESGFDSPEIGMIHYSNADSSYPEMVISSGCVFSIPVIKKIGKHDDSYFVEGQDYEFCLRLKRNRLKILNIHEPLIDHHSLQDGKIFKKWGLSIPVRVYGSRRQSDFNHSHMKLIKCAVLSGQCRITFFLLKSLIYFNVKEIFSKILVKVA